MNRTMPFLLLCFTAISLLLIGCGQDYCIMGLGPCEGLTKAGEDLQKGDRSSGGDLIDRPKERSISLNINMHNTILTNRPANFSLVKNSEYGTITVKSGNKEAVFTATRVGGPVLLRVQDQGNEQISTTISYTITQ